MANYTPQTPALTGTAPSIRTAAAGGDTITVGLEDPVFIEFINANVGASRTITLDDPTSATPANAKSFDPDVDIVVPASSSRIVKIPNPARFRNTTTGAISMTYSAAGADITFKCYT